MTADDNEVRGAHTAPQQLHGHCRARFHDLDVTLNGDKAVGLAERGDRP
jgi:hypothetical protein